MKCNHALYNQQIAVEGRQRRRHDMAKVKIEVMQSLTGEVSIGYRREDLPLVHVIAQEPPGMAFEVGPHFQACPVCKEHKVTEEDFHEWAKAALR